MKRGILCGLVFVTIVGLTSIYVSSKNEVDKLCEKKIVDLVGSKDALGNRKLYLKNQIINEYEYVETVVSNKGIEAINEVEGNVDKMNNNRNFKNVDRKLVRGFDIRNTNENEKFSVALNHEADKGLTVKYKNKEKNKYSEFVVQDKDIMTWMDLSNVYVKDEFAYAVLSCYQGTKVMKIDLNNEKIAKRIDFPTALGINESYLGDNRALVKDNKMYMVSRESSTDYGFTSVIFDLDKETISYKEQSIEEKISNEKSNYMTSIENDGTYAFYSRFYKDKNLMAISVYDMVNEDLREFTINNENFNNLERLNIKNCKVMDNKLYLSGLMQYSIGKSKNFVSVFDWNTKGLEYFGIVEETIRSHNTITEIR